MPHKESQPISRDSTPFRKGSYSIDLRERVVGAVERGLVASAGGGALWRQLQRGVDWVKRHRWTGSLEPGRIGGRKPKKISGDWREWLLTRCRGADFTLRGLVAELAEAACRSITASVWDFVHAEKLTLQKKTLIASERDRPDVARRRRSGRPIRAGSILARLVFIDETWTKTNMAPLAAGRRAASGSRPRSRTAAGRP